VKAVDLIPATAKSLSIEGVPLPKENDPSIEDMQLANTDAQYPVMLFGKAVPNKGNEHTLAPLQQLRLIGSGRYHVFFVENAKEAVKHALTKLRNSRAARANEKLTEQEKMAQALENRALLNKYTLDELKNGVRCTRDVVNMILFPTSDGRGGVYQPAFEHLIVKPPETNPNAVHEVPSATSAVASLTRRRSTAQAMGSATHEIAGVPHVSPYDLIIVVCSSPLVKVAPIWADRRGTTQSKLAEATALIDTLQLELRAKDKEIAKLQKENGVLQKQRDDALARSAHPAVIAIDPNAPATVGQVQQMMMERAWFQQQSAASPASAASLASPASPAAPRRGEAAKCALCRVVMSVPSNDCALCTTCCQHPIRAIEYSNAFNCTVHRSLEWICKRLQLMCKEGDADGEQLKKAANGPFGPMCKSADGHWDMPLVAASASGPLASASRPQQHGRSHHRAPARGSQRATGQRVQSSDLTVSSGASMTRATSESFASVSSLPESLTASDPVYAPRPGDALPLPPPRERDPASDSGPSLRRAPTTIATAMGRPKHKTLTCRQCSDPCAGPIPDALGVCETCEEHMSASAPADRKTFQFCYSCSKWGAAPDYVVKNVCRNCAAEYAADFL